MTAFDSISIEDAPCICGAHGHDGACLCPIEDRVLMNARKGHLHLTNDQRQWCLNQIKEAGVNDYEYEDDKKLASDTMAAWTQAFIGQFGL